MLWRNAGDIRGPAKCYCIFFFYPDEGLKDKNEKHKLFISALEGSESDHYKVGEPCEKETDEGIM